MAQIRSCVSPERRTILMYAHDSLALPILDFQTADGHDVVDRHQRSIRSLSPWFVTVVQSKVEAVQTSLSRLELLPTPFQRLGVRTKIFNPRLRSHLCASQFFPSMYLPATEPLRTSRGLEPCVLSIASHFIVMHLGLIIHPTIPSILLLSAPLPCFESTPPTFSLMAYQLLVLFAFLHLF